MSDADQEAAPLLEELARLRQRVAALEATEAERKRLEAKLAEDGDRLRDVTEREHAESRVAYLATLLSQVHDAVIATDENLC